MLDEGALKCWMTQDDPQLPSRFQKKKNPKKFHRDFFSQMSVILSHKISILRKIGIIVEIQTMVKLLKDKFRNFPKLTTYIIAHANALK